MNNYKFKLAIIISFFLPTNNFFEPQSLTYQKNLQFISDLNTKQILASIDEITNDKYNANLSLSLRSFFSFKKKNPLIEIPLNKINSSNTRLASAWNSTSMIFGAAADGVGIGTTFAVKKLQDGSMLFVTNFHVVENFCIIPQDITKDIDENNNQKYPCQALFVLHDIAINTKTNSAEVDGKSPWKSERNSLEYFDKQKDIAAFRIELPIDNDIEATTLENNYDLKTLLISRNNAEKINPKLPPIIMEGIEMSPITAFSLYLVAFSIPKANQVLIQKQWFKGITEGSKTFENDKKLGFISA